MEVPDHAVHRLNLTTGATPSRLHASLQALAPLAVTARPPRSASFYDAVAALGVAADDARAARIS